MVTLKGGQTTEDIRLDRVEQFDERSRQYPIRALVGARRARSYTWGCSTVLDQGREGACVGFAWTHELLARPAPVEGLRSVDALALYRLAQTLDEWPGEAYSGTSVLAGVKALQQQGFYGEYRWAFGVEDLVLAIPKGPAVLGIPWYESMYEAPGGVVRIGGAKVGGHAILCRGVNVTRGYFLLHNSWGADWGVNGAARITISDLDRLLREDGEACIPIERKRP